MQKNGIFFAISLAADKAKQHRHRIQRFTSPNLVEL
jgi:hypothetical protein